MSATVGTSPVASDATPRGQRSRPFLWPLARVALNVLLVAGGLVVLAWLAVTLRLVVVPLLVSLLIATLLVPPVDALRRRGVPSAPATVVTMLVATAVLGGILALIVPGIVSQLGTVATAAEDGIDRVATWLVGGPLGLEQRDIDDSIDQAATYLQDNAGQISGGVAAGATLVGEIIAGMLLALVIVFFFVHDGRRLWNWAVAIVPAAQRETVDAAGHRIWTTTAGYVRGVTIIALIDAVLIGIALAIIGVPLVVPLAALMFLGAYIPLAGVVVAGTLAALVALVSGGVIDALLVIAVIAVIQQLEGDLLYPVVVGRTVALHPLAILLVLAAGTVLAGLIGALLSVPVAAATWTAVAPLLLGRNEAAQEPDPAPAAAPAEA